MLRKIGLYILSLWLLFFFVIIVTFKIPATSETDDASIYLSSLFHENYTSFFALLFLLIGLLVYLSFRLDLKGATDIPFEIKIIESINYEHLMFLATYIIPLICFDLESVRYLIVLLFLLIAMGIIYIKTDLFYANPSLALLGFHIYKVSGNFKTGKKNNIILLTRYRLSNNQKVSHIKLDERIFFVKPQN